MANYPKAKDPTEIALSAIQEALNMRETEETPDSLRPEARTGDPDLVEGPGGEQHPMLPFAEDLPPFPASALRNEEALRRAANDDRETIGQVLQSLQRRAARTPYIVAGLFAAAWVVSALGLAFGYGTELKSLFGHAGAAVPLAVALTLGFALPVVFFFLLAQMVARSEELRFVSHAMARAAVRFAEPEFGRPRFDCEHRAGHSPRSRGDG